MARKRKRFFATVLALSLIIPAVNSNAVASEKSTVESDSLRLVKNAEGPTLGYSSLSGVNILTVDGGKFKDLNKNGRLDPYEDWRLPVEQRAKDLASKMSVEQIAGLMLYSSHQSLGNEDSDQPTDTQLKFLKDDEVRHILITNVFSPEVAAKWNNNAQAFVESLGLGIPINTSSDPRHGTIADAEFNAGAGGKISMWPNSLGMAATFDPNLVLEFGKIAQKEYRALGIGTALSPQIDMPGDPRWYRFNGSFGEDAQVAADMARTYVDGFQTSEGEAEIADGWGYDSVNAMVKHWPGGGAGEAGRDAHYPYGKYAVYPGNNLHEHMVPFINGAFDLEGSTKRASAVMPYYTISYNQDDSRNENVGNAFSKTIITDMLRNGQQYDGVITTDWGVTNDQSENFNQIGRSPWGVEHLTVAERRYKALMAGVDQFGGANDKAPVIEAYRMGVVEHGEKFMRERFEQSAVRLLTNIFRLGLMENPYLDIGQTIDTVGNAEFMEAGYRAQQKSIVMVKNRESSLPVHKDKKVYIPKKADGSYSMNLDVVKRYYAVTDNPAEADFSLVLIESPKTGTGYNAEDREAGGNGYFPISLQYEDYTAEFARQESVAGGDPLEDFTNRSYKGKTVSASNKEDTLDLVLETRKVMGKKPVIVALNMAVPTIVKEFENQVDGLLVTFNVQQQAILDIVSGTVEPSGLLPMQIPANMKTVEWQYEDLSHDMDSHIDSEGNIYNFAYGLNWDGIIVDERTEKYAKEAGVMLTGKPEVPTNKQFNIVYTLTGVDQNTVRQEIQIKYDSKKADFISAETLMDDLLLSEKRTDGEIHLTVEKKTSDTVVTNGPNLRLNFKANDPEKDSSDIVVTSTMTTKNGQEIPYPSATYQFKIVE